MDYLVIGCNGFAQVGQPNFRLKNKAEMSLLMEYLEITYPIPEEFSGMCLYKVKWFQHDFGSYSEVVLMYNDHLVEEWEVSDPEKGERFWKWFIQVEAANLESDALTGEIESSYQKLLCRTEQIPEIYESKAS